MRYPTDSEFDAQFTTDDLTDEEIDNTDLADKMNLESGDQYLTPNGSARDVVKVAGHRNSVTVTNPFKAHPQAAMSGNWSEDLTELYVEWRKGNITPANLSIEAETAGEEAAFASDTNAALQDLQAKADDTPEFLSAVKEVINTRFEQATIGFGCEFVHVNFPPAETGGEPAVKATFSIPEAGSVCKNGNVRVLFESSESEWQREETEILASDSLYEALKETLAPETEARLA
ncbi:hypothetical protein [Halobacterium rubrum]|jgi:hypothetical protein|uniref:hypothetical protein n=1 Tax=Halobacterium TaxID=2239 RepID=UPI001F22043F|nr:MULTISPECIES: hypothetical protein [Halobacterium]MDH5021754.1 hypothetical protein [Halobacterium rubrum]